MRLLQWEGLMTCYQRAPQLDSRRSDWTLSCRRFWEESFGKLDMVVNQMKKMEASDSKKHG